jgi:hypothetical protein
VLTSILVHVDHCQVTSEQTDYETTAVAKEQLCKHVVSPSLREHAAVLSGVLRVAVAEAGQISGTHGKGSVRCWKSLSSNG